MDGVLLDLLRRRFAIAFCLVEIWMSEWIARDAFWRVEDMISIGFQKQMKCSNSEVLLDPTCAPRLIAAYVLLEWQIDELVMNLRAYCSLDQDGSIYPCEEWGSEEVFIALTFL